MQSSQRLKLRGLNLSTAASVCERPPRVEVIKPIVNDWSGQSHQGSACLRRRMLHGGRPRGRPSYSWNILNRAEGASVDNTPCTVQ
jgi:hypothetical protein